QGYTFQVGFGGGLAVNDIFGCDKVLGDRKAGITQAGHRQRARSRSYDGKSSRRQGAQKPIRAGKGGYPGFVLDFPLLDNDVLTLGIYMWSDGAKGLNAAASVRLGDDHGGIKTMFDGPLAPDALDGGR